MKLNSSGVILAILILIIMILICHTMNFFYPKNTFVDISNNNNNDNNTPKQTDYNKIYYTSDSNEKQLCANVDQAEIPCEIVRTCKTEPVPTPAPTFGLDSLSNSEIAVLYKVAYEASAREVLTRTLKDIKPTIPQSNPWGF